MGFWPLEVVVARGRPEDVFAALDADEIWSNAKARGLMEKRVLVNEANPKLAIVETWWKSPSEWRKFLSENTRAQRLSINTRRVRLAATKAPALYMSQKRYRKVNRWVITF